MPKRIDIGTDIATIGVWDPTRERHDLKAAKYADFLAGLESEAKATRLFFVKTGADGGFLTDVYVDEQPSSDCLSLYSPVEREFAIEAPSGRLIAGGIEDFVSSAKQITSEKDLIEVAPGMYALKFYELIEDKLVARLQEHIGAEDYAHYERRFSGWPWGCLLFMLALVCLMITLWLASAVVFALWSIYLVVRFRIHASDSRFQDIAKRIDAFDKQFPPFIYVLRGISSSESIVGGWHKLS